MGQHHAQVDQLPAVFEAYGTIKVKSQGYVRLEVRMVGEEVPLGSAMPRALDRRLNPLAEVAEKLEVQEHPKHREQARCRHLMGR